MAELGLLVNIDEVKNYYNPKYFRIEFLGDKVGLVHDTGDYYDLVRHNLFTIVNCLIGDRYVCKEEAILYPNQDMKDKRMNYITDVAVLDNSSDTSVPIIAMELSDFYNQKITDSHKEGFYRSLGVKEYWNIDFGMCIFKVHNLSDGTCSIYYMDDICKSSVIEDIEFNVNNCYCVRDEDYINDIKGFNNFRRVVILFGD